MMKLSCLALGASLVLLISMRQTGSAPQSPAVEGKHNDTPPPAFLEVTGRTQCILTRRSTVAPVPLHPVVEVLVQPGDRVKKGQVLVKLDDDEPQADVRNKEAMLESARIAFEEARRYLARCEESHQSGALPEKRYFEARAGVLKAEMDQRAAKAGVDAAKAELEHYAVTAEIDGVINWLEVHPGMVSRPGTTVWGEILDLRELEVRCALHFDQVDRVTVGQKAQVRQNGKQEVFGIGRVTFVGLEAAKDTGLVPVLVRLTNTQQRLRCEVPVQVRFTEALAVARTGP